MQHLSVRKDPQRRKYYYYYYYFSESKYRNLCSLCDSPGDCAYNTQLTGSHYAALNCLAERGGDVAYTSLGTARDYFKVCVFTMAFPLV